MYMKKPTTIIATHFKINTLLRILDYVNTDSRKFNQKSRHFCSKQKIGTAPDSFFQNSNPTHAIHRSYKCIHLYTFTQNRYLYVRTPASLKVKFNEKHSNVVGISSPPPPLLLYHSPHTYNPDWPCTKSFFIIASLSRERNYTTDQLARIIVTDK